MSTPSAFGAYRVLHQIGSGALGPVFRAHEAAGDRLRAVKAFRLDLIPEDAARLADALGRLVGAHPPHPALVAAVDAGVDGSTAYLVTDYVPGETLDQVMRQMAPAAPTAALPLVAAVAEALDAAWAAGLGHGALHPRDVFVEQMDGGAVRVKLTGIGVVAALDAAGVKPPVRRPYAAPERLAGTPWDERADVYALAAIAHELLTGRRPAGGGEQAGAFAPGVPPAVRVALRRVLARGLATDPAGRHESAPALAAALQEAAGGQLPLPIGESAQAAIDERVATADSPPQISEVADRLAPDDYPAVDLPIAMEAPLPTSVEPASVGVPVASLVLDEPVRSDVARSPAPVPPARLDVVPPGDPPSRGRSSDRAVTVSGYPWAALAAVGVACLAVGVVVGVLIARVWPGMPMTPDETVATAVSVPLVTEVPILPAPAAEPPPAPPPPAVQPVIERRVPAPRGRLVVRSEPAGALLTIDGRLHGETPVTVEDLPLGVYSVQVARPGYTPEAQQVVLTAASPSRTLAVTLKPGADGRRAATGSIVIDSRPRGARVYVDDRLVGTTPHRLATMTVGAHRVRIEMDGYRPVTATVDVEAGREARVAVTLERGSAGGRH